MTETPKRESGTRDTGWAADYQHTSGREPRPLIAKGMAVLEAANVPAGKAIEIGFGDGTETLALLRMGWHVFDIVARRPGEQGA